MNRRGLVDWMLQRFSAIVLLVYVVVIGSLVVIYPIDSYSRWSALFSNPIIQLATFLAVLAVVVHAWIGLWTILTDYVKSASLRLIGQALIIVVLLSLLVWSLPVWYL